MLALGNAPSYQHAFAEALEADIVRFPAVTDQGLFEDAVPVSERASTHAWKLEVPARARWTQAVTGTQISESQIFGDHVVFANGDRLDGLHPRTAELEVSGYPVMERFHQARENLELSTNMGLAARKAAGAIAAILTRRRPATTHSHSGAGTPGNF